MDILNTVKSALGGGQQNDIISIIISSIGGKNGLDGLVSQFVSKGLGDIINSWIGIGKNLPVSGDQLKSVFGETTITDIAAKLGIDPNAVTSQLSNLLPDVVDKLTPGGKIPEGDLLSQATDLLGGLFGKK